jgi:hypothetical protein
MSCICTLQAKNILCSPQKKKGLLYIGEQAGRKEGPTNDPRLVYKHGSTLRVVTQSIVTQSIAADRFRYLPLVGGGVLVSFAKVGRNFELTMCHIRTIVEILLSLRAKELVLCHITLTQAFLLSFSSSVGNICMCRAAAAEMDQWFVPVVSIVRAPVKNPTRDTVTRRELIRPSLQKVAQYRPFDIQINTQSGKYVDVKRRVRQNSVPIWTPGPFFSVRNPALNR